MKNPVAKPELQLYAWYTPNGQKVVIALEEAGAKYQYHGIDIRNGDQHAPSFRAISPDGKIPALVVDGDTPVTMFESGAILFYLAQRYPELNGKTPQERALTSSWTFWQVGQLGPLAGQFGRFSGAADPNPQAVEHFEQLLWHCLKVMETRLSESTYLAGESFTIADIACIPWIASKQSYLQIYNVPWQEKRPALNLWASELTQRPSVKTALN